MEGSLGCEQSRGHYKVFSHRFLLISISALGVVYIEIQQISNSCSSADDKAATRDDLRILAMVLNITHVKTASHDVANVHMSFTAVTQFTAFVSACSSEDFHKYDTRNIRPDSLPFS